MGDVMILIFLGVQVVYYLYAKRQSGDESDFLVILGGPIAGVLPKTMAEKCLGWEERDRLRKLHGPGRTEQAALRYVNMKAGAVYLILAVGTFFSIAIGRDYIKGESLQAVIKRPDYGESKQSMDLVYTLETDTGEIVGEMPLEIPAQLPPPSERYAYLESLYTPLLNSMVGQGQDPEAVYSDLNFEQMPFELPVKVRYEPVSLDYIDGQGCLKKEAMAPETAYPVQVMVEMKLEDEALLLTYDFTVFRKVLSPEEEAALIRERLSIEEDRVLLPTVMSENEGAIRWQAKEKGLSMAKLLFGTVLLAVLAHWAAKYRLEAEVARRREMILCDFPKLVSKLTMLIGAGMTFNRAWLKIVSDYQDQKKSDRPLYEEMVVATEAMRNGVPISQVLEAFGRRTENREVMRMTAVLTQNIQLGGNALSEALKQLSEEAWALRMNTAKIRGEKASTKLLIPLGISFGALLLIILGSTMMSLKL